MNVQQIVNETENLAKYIQMINNQVQQINTLTAQLQQLQQYNVAFGNPAALVNIAGANNLTVDLTSAPVGKNIESLQVSAQGAEAMTFTGNGLYVSIGSSFATPSGSQVQRDQNLYRDNAAVQNAVENYTNVFDDVTKRRRAIKDNIATTIQKLQSATTASEVQKLTGVLIGLNSDLAATDKEVDQAVGLAVVQDAENRDNVAKQSKARTEQQQAEFSEALTNYGATFQPITGPPTFPTQ
jgi:hypothetical protein